ncbi:MAG: hypothetical protein KGV50_01975 [Gammaproteobacteria bacterium]|nr:hypothetical protein [Gammaproteobacteria bacterium]
MTTKRKIISWLLITPVIAVGAVLALNYIFYKEPAEKFIETGNVAELLQSIADLENTLSQSPEKAHLRLELAHGYEAMGHYDKAITAYGKAWKKVERAPDELLRFAEVLARSKGHNYTGKPLELINTALEIDSNNIDALIMKGTAMLSTKQKAVSLEYWQKAYGLLDEQDPRFTPLGEMLEKLEQGNALLGHPLAPSGHTGK